MMIHHEDSKDTKIPDRRLRLTASGKEAALWEFYRQLRMDGIFSVSELARRAGVGRSALTSVLNGRRRGVNTWKHVLPMLSEAALIQLKQCSAWNEDCAQAARAALRRQEITVGAFRMMKLGEGKVWLGHASGEGMETTEDKVAEALAGVWEREF